MVSVVGLQYFRKSRFFPEALHSQLWDQSRPIPILVTKAPAMGQKSFCDRIGGSPALVRILRRA